MFTFAPAFYRTCYEPAPPVLRGAAQRPLTAEEMTESCEWLLAQAQERACPYWLLDGRRHTGNQPLALHQWMQEEYFPRVRQALGRVPCVAFLVSAPVWAGLRSRGYDNPLDWHTPTARLGWFTDEAPARAWLARQRSSPVAVPGA